MGGSCSILIKDAISQLDSARWISLGGNDSGKISVKFGFTESHDQNEELDATTHAEENREQNDDLEKNNKKNPKGNKLLPPLSMMRLRADKSQPGRRKTPNRKRLLTL